MKMGRDWPVNRPSRSFRSDAGENCEFRENGRQTVSLKFVNTRTVTAGWAVIQASPANRWSSATIGRTLGFHPGCETIVSVSSIVMPSGRSQFRNSVCASELNAWFDRNQRLIRERQESRNPMLKSSRRPPPPRELPWQPAPPQELPWRQPSSRELPWEPPSLRELSRQPPSSRELPWPVFC